MPSSTRVLHRDSASGQPVSNVDGRGDIVARRPRALLWPQVSKRCAPYAVSAYPQDDGSPGELHRDSAQPQPVSKRDGRGDIVAGRPRASNWPQVSCASYGPPYAHPQDGAVGETPHLTTPRVHVQMAVYMIQELSRRAASTSIGGE